MFRRKFLNYIAEYVSYGLVMNGNIRFGLIAYVHQIRPSKLPEFIKIPKKVKYFEIDRINKIIYYLTNGGIRRTFYKDDFEINNKDPEVFVADSGILGFKLHMMDLYLYYFRKNKIIIMDTKTRIRKTIYKIDNDEKIIYYMKINSVLKY